MDEKDYRIETFTVEHMTCTSCASRIEKAVSALSGVKKVTVSFAKGIATVVFDDEKVSLEAIHESIVKIGYAVGGKAAVSAAGRAKKAGQFIGVAVIVLAVMLLLRRTGIFNMLPEVEQTMSYSLLFVIGIVTSIHCIGMCGGINLSQSIVKNDTPEGEKNRLKKMKPGMLYNLGRIISYTAVGGAVGALGSIISFSGKAQGIVVAVAGIFMVIFGLNMLGYFPFLKMITPRLPKKFTSGMNTLKSGKGPLLVGLLNGFMPCGPLQSMQLYALGTGSFVAGATSMFLFSVGTVPLMFGFGAVASLLTGKFTSRLMKVSALIVLFLGVGMLGRGFSLTGINFQLPFGKGAVGNIAVVEEGLQEITTKVTSSSYESFVVQKGIPLKWTILVEEGNINGCNNPLTIPEYDVTVDLVPGENIVEFTPDESGTLIYTCWMGMITAGIKVVDDITLVNKKDIEEADQYAAENTSSCCSTGGGGYQPSYDFDLVRKYLSTIKEDRIDFALQNTGLQTAYMEVTDSGFYPAVLIMQSGIQTEWTFNLQSQDPELSSVLFPSYGVQMNMQEGNNTIELVPSYDFVFFNTDNRAIGMVIVIDDVSTLTKGEVADVLESYGAPSIDEVFQSQ